MVCVSNASYPYACLRNVRKHNVEKTDCRFVFIVDWFFVWCFGDSCDRWIRYAWPGCVFGGIVPTIFVLLSGIQCDDFMDDFGDSKKMEWNKKSVYDWYVADRSISGIIHKSNHYEEACVHVGMNTSFLFVTYSRIGIQYNQQNGCCECEDLTGEQSIKVTIDSNHGNP